MKRGDYVRVTRSTDPKVDTGSVFLIEATDVNFIRGTLITGRCEWYNGGKFIGTDCGMWLLKTEVEVIYKTPNLINRYKLKRVPLYRLIRSGKFMRSLTPCERYGYYVGQRFRYTTGGSFSIGSIIELYRDDGSKAPLFRLIDGRTVYDLADGASGAYAQLNSIKPIGLPLTINLLTQFKLKDDTYAI